MPVNKAYRQGQILALIQSRPVHTQEELAQELRNLGIAATQVTLSRDIRELGLAKTPEGYRRITGRAAGPDLAVLASEFVLDVRTAQNLIVVKTAPGHANSVAVALDQERWPEIVGTLAGDDTILIVAPDTEIAGTVRSKLLALLETPA